MKVSKPVLILCICLLLLAGYIHFFTGKKKTKGPVPPTPPAQGQTQPAKPGAPPPAQPQPQGTPPAAPAPQVPAPQATGQSAQAEKPRFDAKAGWASDPFILPVIKGKKGQQEGSSVRLVAILEKGGSRVAVIDKDVVKKGDMIGNEKVAEIGRDRVVLVRGGARRTLTLADADAVATEEALAAKPTQAQQAKPGPIEPAKPREAERAK